MNISIVIPAYNEGKYIGNTLESIKQLEKERDWEIELIVVNGSSTDKTAKIAESYGAKVINEPRKGIGYARQQGLIHATGEIVAFTDADTLVGPDWLIRHIKILKQPNVVLSFGSYRVTDGYFPYYHYTNYIQHYFIALLYYLLRIPYAPGQNSAFWRKKALSIGGYDEKIRMMEDIDLAVRMKKTGLVIYSPDLIVYSSGRRSGESWGMFWRAGWANIQYFLLRQKKLSGFPHFR
jgi:glycosyltransferase involved in cell wall biosynthesis